MPNFSEILGCIIGALLLVILGLGIWLYVDGNRIKTLKVENAEYVEANLELKTSIDKQDAAVKTYEAESAALATAAAKALSIAAKNDAVINTAIDKLKAAKPTSDVCKSADGLFNSYIARKP